MTSHAVSLFTLIFLTATATTLALRLWLGMRQIRHVRGHRTSVPQDFAANISLEDHHKAADYTIAKKRLGMVELCVDTALLLLLTVGGLLQACTSLLGHWFAPDGYAHGVALFAAVGLIGFALSLPFDLYRSFVIEEGFGFNKLTPRVYVSDLVKQLLLAIVIGGPLLLAVLWLMDRMGTSWWLWTWLLWLGFNLLALVLYPTVIAPLFNKFTPLADPQMKARIESLLQRCGFRASGLFVMDGSKRSAHGNAYFTGLGRARRIVFFDTLLARLQPAEVEAVLAHELGHYKLHHVGKRLALLACSSLALLWTLGQLMQQAWFYQGLGVDSGGTTVALILFSLVLPSFTFPLSPLASALARRHEFEADAYAARHTVAHDLVAALLKLYRDNASTLTPDPLHSLFYDSHPPASQRIARLGGVH